MTRKGTLVQVWVIEYLLVSYTYVLLSDFKFT